MKPNLALYTNLLCEIKSRFRQMQDRMALAVNGKMVRLCRDVGEPDSRPSTT